MVFLWKFAGFCGNAIQPLVCMKLVVSGTEEIIGMERVLQG